MHFSRYCGERSISQAKLENEQKPCLRQIIKIGNRNQCMSSLLLLVLLLVFITKSIFYQKKISEDCNFGHGICRFSCYNMNLI